MDDKIHVTIAKASCHGVLAKRKAINTVVAALFHYNKGVFLVVVPHGKRVDMVKTFAIGNAKRQWELSEDCIFKFYVRDMKMLHALKNKAHNSNSQFPVGSLMATWGRFKNMSRDDQVAAKPTINTFCRTTLRSMDVKEAKML
jgi:hypothetical protein